MKVILLNKNDYKRAKRIAQGRNDKPEEVNKKFSDASDISIHLLSALAEVAFEKHTGLPVDESIQPHGDGGIDFVNKNGKTIQVKARDNVRYTNPDLLCRTDYAKADYYVLAELNLINPYEVILVGWCNKERLIKSPVRNMGYGKRYFVKREELNGV